MAHILVVDDEPEIVELVALALERAGHRVSRANGGQEAVTQAAAEPPDAVILDVMMPNMDGLAVLRTLRDGPATQDIPVLLLSAKAHSIDIEVGMKAGAAGYITKPFRPAKVVAEIARITA